MIGVVADDLTGAAELGAIGWRRGLQSHVVLRGGEAETADLVCMDTDSRACAAEEAARRTSAATEHLQRAGAVCVFKKTDSLLRGQVTAEIEAMMKVLGVRRTLLLPMNPSRGRIIAEGKYLVQGIPISETEFARDPGYPRTSASVLKLIQPATNARLTVLKATDAIPEEGILVGEAADSNQVKEWARRRGDDILAAGGAEFFEATLEALHVRHSAPAKLPECKRGRTLFVCGSASDACRAFVQTARSVGVPVCSLPERLAVGGELGGNEMAKLTHAAAASLESRGQVVLAIGLPLVTDPVRSAAFVTDLATLAKETLRRAPADEVCVEGGATAVELATQMGWSRMKVVGEICPGVAALLGETQRAVRLIVKPGSYVWPDNLIDRLQATA